MGLGLAYQSDKVSELEKQPVIKITDNNTQEVQAKRYYKKNVRYIKRYRYVKRCRNGRVRYVRAAYYVKITTRYYTSGKGTGDCWQCSETLYQQLKRKGYHVRIIQYPTSYSSRHRSVQYLSGGRWIDYAYKANGYAWRYYATSNSKYGKVIKSC